jgi:hypothetical protein
LNGGNGKIPKRVRRRSSAGAASQMRGRINLDAFPRGITVAGRDAGPRRS